MQIIYSHMSNINNISVSFSFKRLLRNRESFVKEYIKDISWNIFIAIISCRFYLFLDFIIHILWIWSNTSHSCTATRHEYVCNSIICIDWCKYDEKFECVSDICSWIIVNRIHLCWSDEQQTWTLNFKSLHSFKSMHHRRIVIFWPWLFNI